MNRKQQLSRMLASILLLASGARLHAQSPLWLASVNYESPTLLAPVVLYIVPFDPAGDVTVGILGWTLSGEWTNVISPLTSSVVSADITPLNSHSSNLLYQDGKEDKSLEYRNLTLQLKAGFRIQHTAEWRSEFKFSGLYEHVRGIDESDVAHYWSQPFLGIEVAEDYRGINSEDLVRSRYDGFKLSARLQLLSGTTTWWRTEFSLGVGKKLGSLFFRGMGSYLIGNSLNTVNQFLVGGSWDIPGIHSLYGYHYAEFRMDRGFLFNGGIDMQLFDDWELGLRVGYMRSPAETRYGQKVTLGTLWNGIGLNAGVGFPDNAALRGDFGRVIVVAGFTLALFEPR